ncbi:hypothetical protein EDB85DRAFT_2281309 [Lactarius pseudohatsudake]|nr:hypothetical protein EDB85DRAFT_2281309 [Lactarius pseudohatsudake]
MAKPPARARPWALCLPIGCHKRRASVLPRHILEVGPSGRPANELLRSAAFQTPEGDAYCLDVISMEGLSVIEQWFKVLSEESAKLLLTAFLQRFTRVQIRFFVIVLQQMVRADPMTVLLSPAVGGSMQSQMEAKLCKYESQIARTLTRTFNTSATNRQSLAFDTSSSFLSPDTANTVGNPSDAAATLAQQRAKLKTAGNAAHHISTPALASSGERGTLAGVLGQSTDFSGLSAGSAFHSSLPDGGRLDRLSPVSDSWASMKMSSNNNNGQAVAAKLKDLYGSTNVLRLDGPDKFRRPSKGHIGDSSSGSNNGVTDSRSPVTPRLVSVVSKVALQGACAMAVAALGPVLKVPLSRTHWVVSAEAMTEAMRWLRRISKPRWDRNGLNLAQLAQLNGMNPFNMNMNMPRWGCRPRRSYSLRRSLLLEEDSDRLGSASVQASARSEAAGSGGAKKDEEDFEPSVLNDVAGWLRTLRLHKYTPNFEGMTWKEMVVMDEQALEAQGVAALGARRQMLKTFEVVRKKMGIDDPSAPPPPSSGRPASGSISGGSAGSSGGPSV